MLQTSIIQISRQLVKWLNNNNTIVTNIIQHV